MRAATLGRRLAGLDRRWIYLTLAGAVVASMLGGLRLPGATSPLVQPLYDEIERLPSGSPVLVSFEYTPSTVPELEPMAYAVVRHLLLRGDRICFTSLWPDGNNLISRVVESVVRREFPDRVEGRDWVVLGYKAGGEMVVNALRQGLDTMYATDLRGVPVADIPALAGVRSLSDFRLLVSLSAGTPGLKEWILFAGDPLGVPVGGGVNGAGTTQFLPYWPRQLLGLMGGLKGAAEYEAALAQGHPGFHQRTRRASEAMGPQGVAHAVIVLFILLGNAGLLLSRRGGRRP